MATRLRASSPPPIDQQLVYHGPTYCGTVAPRPLSHSHSPTRLPSPERMDLNESSAPESADHADQCRVTVDDGLGSLASVLGYAHDREPLPCAGVADLASIFTTPDLLEGHP